MKKFSFMNKIKLNIEPKRRFLLKQISLLLATVFIFVISVWAWYVGDDHPATATGIQVTMTAANSIEISLNDGADFLGSIDLMDEEQQKFISADNIIKDVLNMKDITSDGKTFYRPVFSDDNSATDRTPDVTKNWDDAGNTAYISEKIVFRTSTPSKIYLGDETTFTTSAEAQNKKLASKEHLEVGNLSGFTAKDHRNGETVYFSTDCIVGALRLAAIDSSNELLYVYIPRKDVELTKDDSDYIIKTGNDVSINTTIHNYYTKSGDTTELFMLTQSEDLVEVLGAAPPIATTTLQEDGTYTATATINIWLEGCDTETTRALSTGRYKIHLDFTATEIAE